MSEPKSNGARPTLPVNTKLNHLLTTYVAAAGAAGVTLLAANPAAEAKVVYTPTHTFIDGNTPIDLNNDGTADFILGFHELSKDLVLGANPAASGNEIMLGAKGGAAAAFFGGPIGPTRKFAASTSGYSWVFMADGGSYGYTWFFGPWANATKKYLGFKFLINGEVHYGWARMTVLNFNHGNAPLLTGYAYETEPNKEILAGETKGATIGVPSTDVRIPERPRATLGALARGAGGLAVWRREEGIGGP
jgi:hypothetical protein